MVNRERDDKIYYARLAEQGERYEDMIGYMKEVANVSCLKHLIALVWGPAKSLCIATSFPKLKSLRFSSRWIWKMAGF